MSERGLWAKVILHAITDATYQGKSVQGNLEKGRADTWFRKGGADFALVCNLAGLDPIMVREAYVGGRIDGSQLSARRQGQKRDD